MTWPGEGLLIKLWETLAEKGVGGLLKPWQIRREGIAQIEVRRAEILALADAERLADEIRAGKRIPSSVKSLMNGGSCDALVAASSVDETLLQPIRVATNAAVADALRAEVNVAKAIAAAEEELRDDTSEIPAKSIDSDWIHRWREFAGGVSATELQALWGRILAGELKSPGKFGFRTLDFIRSLSSDEALKIESVSRFVIEGFIVRSQMGFLESAGILFGELLELQNLGLVSGAEAVGLTVTLKSESTERFTRALCSHGRVIFAKADDPNKFLKLEVYGITRLGQQVMSLGKFEAHEEYLRAVGAEIKAKGFAVELADYVRVDDSTINFSNTTQL